MTNAERYRRHLGDTNICEVCKSGVETTLQILRDCPAMAGIWARLIPARRRQNFFAKSLLEWIHSNLGEEGEMVPGDGSWATMFAIATWWGWKWRCGNIFGENRVWKDKVRFIKGLAAEVRAANMASKEHSPAAVRVERMIA